MGSFTTYVKRWAALSALVWVVWLVAAFGVAADPVVRQGLAGVRKVMLTLFS